MDPIIGGALIGGGASLLGGAVSSIFGSKQGAKNRALQREFAQHGVRWRVEDARAAGVHPLAALGMQGMPFSPVVVPDSIGPALSEAGQNVGRAVAAQMTTEERQMQALALQLAVKNLDEADARIGALNSEAARNYAEANRAQSFPVQDDWFVREMGQGLRPEGFVPSGTINVDSPTVFSHSLGRPEVGAGDTPMWRRFTVAPGIQIELPGGMSGDASEALESLSESPALMAMVVQHNRKNNPAAGVWLADLFGMRDKGKPWYERSAEWLENKLWDVKWWFKTRKSMGDPRSYAY